MVVSTTSTVETVDRDEVKMYYPGLEDIIDQLLDHNISFSHEGDVDLTDDDGIVIASAQMILSELKSLSIRLTNNLVKHSSAMVIM